MLLVPLRRKWRDRIGSKSTRHLLNGTLVFGQVKLVAVFAHPSASITSLPNSTSSLGIVLVKARMRILSSDRLQTLLVLDSFRANE
jgi:hypothetical protein